MKSLDDLRQNFPGRFKLSHGPTKEQNIKKDEQVKQSALCDGADVNEQTLNENKTHTAQKQKSPASELLPVYHKCISLFCFVLILLVVNIFPLGDLLCFLSAFLLFGEVELLEKICYLYK